MRIAANPVRGLAFAGIVSPNFLPVGYPAPESLGFFLAKPTPPPHSLFLIRGIAKAPTISDIEKVETGASLMCEKKALSVRYCLAIKN